MAEPIITRDDPKARRIDFTPPLKVLLVVAEPSDVAPFGGEMLAAAVESALAPLIATVRITRAALATERGIEDMLRAEPWHIIHFIGQGSSRPAARYGTLSLLASDGRTRSINAQAFARLVAKSSTLGLILFQSVAHRLPLQDFEVVTQTLLDAGLPAALWVPDFASPQAGASFTREFYRSVALGEHVDLAIDGARRAIASGDLRQGQLDARAPVLFSGEAALTTGVVETEVVRPQRVQPAVPAIENAAAISTAAADQLAAGRRKDLKLALERKRAAGEFDVFLCHNVADKPAVKDIGLRLRELAILPWLDEWELRPGMPWQRLLEEQMGNIRSAVVFVGREGIGPWQRQELDGFLREFAQRHCPVIPVLLPGAPVEPRLPRFLEGMTWVDFRIQDPEPMARLIWGITGQAPAID